MRGELRSELEFLVKLYKFYEDAHYFLKDDYNFKKFIDTQEMKVAHLINETIKNKEEE